MTMAVRWLSVLTAALVLIQAILIGQALYVGDLASMTALHGWLGNVSFVAGLLVTALAFLAYRRGEVSGLVLWLGVVIVILMVAQLGLGYSGRRGGWPAALHIPNGVLITGLLFTLVSATMAPRPQAGELRA